MKKKNRWIGTAAVGALLGTAFMASTVASASAAEGDAPQPFSCTATGLLTQEDEVWSVDLASGDVTNSATLPVSINGGGFNVLDGYVYAWDYTDNGIGRYGSDGSFEFLGLPEGMVDSNWNIGDVSADGYLWVSDSQHTYVKIDVRPGSSTFMTIVDSGALTLPADMKGRSADWVFVPGHDGYLYTVAQRPDDHTVLVLWRMDTTTHEFERIGDLGRLKSGKSGAFGAMYADADGFMYGSDNFSGEIVRIDVNRPKMSHFTTGPASHTNDGMRCAQAILPLDFGDAPDTYGTTLDADGARHSLVNWSSDSAELMLGTSVTRETDANLDGDQDDALSEAPAATAGKPTSVDVAVTNTSDQDAKLYGWYDTNMNGKFDEGENIAPVAVASGSGQTTVPLDLPATDKAGDTWLRLRISFDAAVTPTSDANGGEIEDWPVSVAEAPAPAPATATVAVDDQANTVGDKVSVPVESSSSDGSSLEFAAEGLPDGVVISPATGVMTGVPTTAGTYSVTVTATSETAGTVETTFTWTVNPAATPTPAPDNDIPSTDGMDTPSSDVNSGGDGTIADVEGAAVHTGGALAATGGESALWGLGAVLLASAATGLTLLLRRRRTN
ncbi:MULTISPECIES: Ig domain-containing protein [unclassified Microbacterium]|uniref:Ig domain-containing protein n=1 Tax=unclassified Microbacterium TaxID=2609290 RepID=UPI0012F7A92E|nr:Ig domain-containing protein [Microbacterium sp. MAH-37]